MTKDKDEKAVIRARMARTGESYAAARAQLAPAAAGGRGGPGDRPPSLTFMATPPVAAALKATADYGGGTWALVLALRAGDGLAARVLEGLGLSVVTPNDQAEHADPALFARQVEAGSLKDVMPPVVKLATAENKTVFDSALLLRAAVSVLDEADVPPHRGQLLRALKAADLAKLCGAAERQHGPEEPAKQADGSERTGMFERFTDKARRVVVLSQEEARQLGHDYIGTEHLLLGLLHEGDGIGGRALTALGVSLEATRLEVETIIGRGTEPVGGHIPFTPRAKSTLEQSLRAAVEMNHNYIGTEHILLGLLVVGECVATTVLLQHDEVTLESVRAKVLELLEEYRPDDYA